MKRTKLVFLTTFIMVAVMLFTACGGTSFNAKLNDSKAMELIDSYDVSAFDGDFALGMEVGLKAEGVDLNASLNAQFKRTQNFYNAYVKIDAGVIGDMLESMLSISNETQGDPDSVNGMNSILLMLLSNGEFWLSNDKLFLKSGNDKFYLDLPEEITSLSLKSSDFNSANIIASVLEVMDLEIELFKSDGTINWDGILEEAKAPANAIDEIKDIIEMLPIGSKGEPVLSKFFKNFTTYNLSYDKTSKRNIISANLNFDKLVEKLNALGQAVGEDFLDDVEEILSSLESVSIKFVLGQKYFESIEVSLNIGGLGLSLDGFEDFTVKVKFTFAFTPQTFTIPAIDGFPKKY